MISSHPRTDLKPLNAVRSRAGAWQLIDFDAAPPTAGDGGVRDITAYKEPDCAFWKGLAGGRSR